MTRARPDTCSGGFTLVELAISLVVIGLLIGGVLKGKELIDNARLTRINSDARAYEAGVIAFMEIYGGLPGNVVNPEIIPNCANNVVCNVAGTGKDIIGGSAAVLHYAISNFASTYMNSPNRRFFLQLAAAGIVPRVDMTNTNTSYVPTPGVEFPESPVDGFYFMWPRLNEGLGIYGPASAHYLVPFGTISAFGTGPTMSGRAGMTVRQAFLLDTKYDDGVPGGTGNILAYQPLVGAQGNCLVGNAYNMANANGRSCEVFIKMHEIIR